MYKIEGKKTYFKSQMLNSFFEYFFLLISFWKNVSNFNYIYDAIVHKKFHSYKINSKTQKNASKMLTKHSKLRGIVSNCLIILIFMTSLFYCNKKRRQMVKTEFRWQRAITTKPERIFSVRYNCRVAVFFLGKKIEFIFGQVILELKETNKSFTHDCVL